ncbi:MAG TPA: hypothetical protein VK722_14175 [Candidatus Aquilonibacter sp.]|nr:hypothetical protein [Candidatus Aquilonibacter sp.]
MLRQLQKQGNVTKVMPHDVVTKGDKEVDANSLQPSTQAADGHHLTNTSDARPTYQQHRCDLSQRRFKRATWERWRSVLRMQTGRSSLSSLPDQSGFGDRLFR